MASSFRVFGLVPSCYTNFRGVVISFHGSPCMWSCKHIRRAYDKQRD